MSDVTQVLDAIEQGDGHAAEQLLPLIYEELRKLASQRMAREGQTFQAGEASRRPHHFDLENPALMASSGDLQVGSTNIFEISSCSSAFLLISLRSRY